MQTFLLIKSLSLLAGVLALIYFCFYWYKKRSGLRASTNNRIRIVEQRQLDQRTTMSLVRIDDREMIIVSHPNAIALQSVPDSVGPRSFKDIAIAKNAVQ